MRGQCGQRRPRERHGCAVAAGHGVARLVLEFVEVFVQVVERSAASLQLDGTGDAEMFIQRGACFFLDSLPSPFFSCQPWGPDGGSALRDGLGRWASCPLVAVAVAPFRLACGRRRAVGERLIVVVRQAVVVMPPGSPDRGPGVVPVPAVASVVKALEPGLATRLLGDARVWSVRRVERAAVEHENSTAHGVGRCLDAKSLAVVVEPGGHIEARYRAIAFRKAVAVAAGRGDRRARQGLWPGRFRFEVIALD